MKGVLLLILCLVALGSNAQTEVPMPGARWMYYDPGSASPSRQLHYIYAGDTIIDGFTDVKVLKEETRTQWSLSDIELSESRSFFRNSNDSILHYVDGEFKLMFDFDVQVGDTRIVDIDWCYADEDTMRIDSLGSMNYKGEDLTVYYFTMLLEDQLDSLEGENPEPYLIGGVGGGRFVERIGFMSDHPTDLYAECVVGALAEYVSRNFTCYTDNELAVTYTDTCNLFLSENETKLQDLEVAMFQEQLVIKNAQNSTLQIFDVLGKELNQQQVYSDNESIDISHLPTGVLLVSVESEQGRLTKKVYHTHQ